MVTRSLSRPCYPEDVPMSRGRPHRRFRRLSGALWKMLGPRTAGGHAMFLVSGACNRALANTLLREPLITHRELTSASPSLSRSFSQARGGAPACLASSSSSSPGSSSPSLRPGYRISYSASDVHGSRLPAMRPRNALSRGYVEREVVPFAFLLSLLEFGRTECLSKLKKNPCNCTLLSLT